ncbi:MAG: MATE family efflux transporter [Leptospiraceae bacterium]|nr:MATE family efflux transporter [Leptospiraceae bacterium]
MNLAIPVFFGMISQTLIQVSDTFMVGKLGAEAIAAAGLGGLAYFTILAFLMYGSVGVQIVTAKRFGEKKDKELGELLLSLLYFSFFVGILLSLVGYYLAFPYTTLLNNDAALVQKTASYLSYRFVGTFFFFMSFGLRGFLDGLGLTYVGMLSSILTMLSNIFLNWVFIFGNLGVPALGIDGAGIASSLSGGIGLLVFISFLFTKKIQRYFQLSKIIPDFSILKESLFLGLPPAMDGLLTNMAFLLFNKLAGLIGVHSLAASNIIFSIMSLSFMPGFSFGVAATTILGQAIGRKSPFTGIVGVYRSAHYSALLMGIMGLIFIVFGKEIISLFTTETFVIQATYPALILVSLVQVGDAYHMVMGSALRTVGLVYWVMFVYIICSYAIMLPIAYILGIIYNFGTAGLWSSISVWLLVLGFVFTYKFKKADWLKN